MSKNGSEDSKNVRFYLSGPEIGPESGLGRPSRRRRYWPCPRAVAAAAGSARALLRARLPAGCLARACGPPGPAPCPSVGLFGRSWLTGPGPPLALNGWHPSSRPRAPCCEKETPSPPPLCPLAIREVFPCLRIGGNPYHTAGPLPIQRSCRVTTFPRVIPRSGESLPRCGERRSTKRAKVDDVASTITGDLLMLLHKNFHILNDVVTMVPKRSDRASLPPSGYLTVSETSLRARLCFSPPAELVKILRSCGVCLLQFSYRAMSVTVGLITLFRDRGAVLTPEHLSRMGRLTSDMQGPMQIVRHAHPRPCEELVQFILFVRNDWGLLEKWGKMRDLPAPLHVGEDDIMRLLKVHDVELLLYEVRYLNKYIEEEFLFKVGLSFHPGRSDAQMLKPTSKVPEPPVPVDLERAQATITQLCEDQRASGEKVAVLEAENKRSQTLIAEKEVVLTSFESSRVIDDFKKSIAFKIIIQDHVQEACDHIYEVEVKALEQQCLDDGFIRGFLKGVRLMQRKTGVEVEGLTPSQASDDFPPGSDGDEIESELQKAFALEADDEVVDIE
ncbi:hypothetical protein IEQ34_013566 [Dendrobium chrysotoxum]|uniref:Uncharacterized protein n=1 Tax=Dendrobium chrysotoxum TaxID=161865 RepID=A0AAV7GNR9_DENCH|nr:hypothetical protein IEQ34_013566 [Dendrobium chrysotoxum]